MSQQKSNRQLLQDTHDAVIELRTEVKQLSNSKNDHEKRIRLLERFVSVLTGFILFIKFIFKG